MANAGIDANRKPSLLALSNADGTSLVALWADPTTHRLLVDLPTTGGTVTSVSVVSANGFAGTVATATTTPAITLTTSINSPVLAGNGTAIAAAATTGTGSTVALATSPSFTTPVLGTPTSGTLTNCTGYTVANVSGLGTGVATALAVNVGSAGAPVLFNGAGGTPSSLTLTNATGLPVAGITASTSTALGVGSIELGNATDTTLSRSSGGVLAVEGVVIPSISSTNTVTNKRVTRRLTTTNNPGATPTTNSDNVDVMDFTGCANAITSMTTNLSGTPVNGDLLEIRLTDNGTARAITWGASFGSTTVTLPTTTVISTMLRVLFEWNGSIWQCIATA